MNIKSASITGAVLLVAAGLMPAHTATTTPLSSALRLTGDEIVTVANAECKPNAQGKCFCETPHENTTCYLTYDQGDNRWTCTDTAGHSCP